MWRLWCVAAPPAGTVAAETLLDVDSRFEYHGLGIVYVRVSSISMSQQESATLIVLAYKIASMLVGLAFAHMGYRLFMAGVYEKAGDLKAAWRGTSLVLRQAAPGTFFAVLGAVIVTTAVFKGLSVAVAPTSPATSESASNSADQAKRELLSLVQGLNEVTPTPTNAHK
jgi:hypothetical protein